MEERWRERERERGGGREGERQVGGGGREQSVRIRALGMLIINCGVRCMHVIYAWVVLSSELYNNKRTTDSCPYP